jgi:hypothetical protein
MRIHLLLLLAALAVPAPAGAAIRNFGVNGFDRVRVDGPYRVSLVTGVAPFANASGSQTALDSVDIDVQGRTLVVHVSTSSWGGYPGEERGPVEIKIGTHDLSAAYLNGAGSLAIDKVKALSFELSVQGSGIATIGDTDVDQLTVGVVGSASAVLSGRAARLTTTIRGVSSLDAAGMTVKDATITADGAATVKANITNAVKVYGTGPATITLAGNPACTSKLSGSATLSGCAN